MEACSVAHHWLIDTLPTAGSYYAKCRKCGAGKVFPFQDPRFRFRMFRKPVPQSVVEPPLGSPAKTS